ncbi:hypothetical protein [Polaromonas sp. YR568]|uniref:hypothetical protein n=1 Tax=Polaromonas sp. YR568 TaxID=1855301 RepID=UPI003137B6F3
MIIEIALGVALGLFIFANWRGLLGLSTLVFFFVLLLVLAGVACWTMYSGFQAVRALPPLLQPGSLASNAFSQVFSLLLNLLLVFAISTVLEQRLRLARREALALGFVFYILFLVSVFAVPIAIEAYLATRARTGLLLLVVLLAAWVLAVLQCLKRTRMARQ